MLSEDERRILAEIEDRFDAEESEAAVAAAVARKGGGERLAHDVVLAAAVLGMIVCFVFGAVGPGVVAMVFAAVVLALRLHRFPRKN